MKKPIIESEIPIIKPGEDFIERALKSYVDDQLALIGIVGGEFSSDKIVIVFEKENTEWPDGFHTKYFLFKEDEPGVLSWGHDGRSMKIEHRD
ncbi:MAG: hypothetical protein H8E25_14990 [Planctomycetes bacterium]|nr:hypothetical protein [Planctomycetota bacterium]